MKLKTLLMNEAKEWQVMFGEVALAEYFVDDENNKCRKIVEVKDDRGNRYNAINITKSTLKLFPNNVQVRVVS